VIGGTALVDLQIGQGGAERKKRDDHDVKAQINKSRYFRERIILARI
jgi:hypothetical protein